MVKKYNTGNAVPSGDPKDFSDNSITVDDFVNSQKKQVVNRIGESLYTLFGIEGLAKNKIEDFQATIDLIIKEAGGISVLNEVGNSIEFPLSQNFVLRSIDITPQMFGAKADGIANDAPAIQDALDFIEEKGGGVLYMPAGTYNLSKGYRHDDICVIVPDNVYIKGAGIDATNIRRTPAERKQTGVLFVTKKWDTAFKYDGAKNQMYTDFTIQDGDPNNYKTSGGGLLAFGHASNILVERVKGIDFDQHLTDICGCENVIVRNCIVNNKVMNTGAAPFQIDVAGQGIGILGLNKDNTSNRNVFIYNNIVEESHSTRIVHFHHSQEFDNIHIKNNFIRMSDKVDQYGIGDDGSSYQHNANGLFIEGNTILLRGKGRGISFFGKVGTNIKNMHVNNNTITGEGDHGILIGHQDGYNVDVNVRNNVVDIYNNTETSGRCGGIVIQSSGVVNAKYNDVKAIFSSSSSSGPYGNGGLTVSFSSISTIHDNDIYAENKLGKGAFYGIRTNNSDIFSIGNNRVMGIGVSYGISYRHDDYSLMRGTISSNKTDGDFIVSNYADPASVCDGTNDVTVFDFKLNNDENNSKLLLIKMGEEYSFDLYKTKNTTLSDVVPSYSVDCVMHRTLNPRGTAKVINNNIISYAGGFVGVDVQIQSDNRLLIRTGNKGAYAQLDAGGTLRVFEDAYLTLKIGI